MIPLIAQISKTSSLMRLRLSLYFSVTHSKPPSNDSLISPLIASNDPPTAQPQTSPLPNDKQTQFARPKTIVLSEQAQKAVWASKIIETIIDSKPPQSIKQSLRQQIIDLTIDTTDFDFELDQKFKNDVFELFTTGVKVNTKIYQKKRVKDALIDGKLIFFPTSAVSKIIFKCFHENRSYNLTGSYGIGKTLSIILYQFLSSHVIKFDTLARAPWIQVQRQQKYKTELDLLNKNNLIKKRVSKCYYWCVPDSLELSEDEMRQLILEQLNDFCFSDEMIKRFNGYSKLQDLVFQINHSNIKFRYPTILLIDQINVLTSAFSKWNFKVDQHRKQYDNIVIVGEKLRQFKAQQYFPAYNMKQLINRFKNLGRNTIFSSSIPYEEQLIERSRQYYHITLTYFDNGNAMIKRLQYSERLRQNQIKVEFCQLFLFLLEIYCERQKIPQKNIKGIKQFLTLEAMNVKNYYRFLFIREFLESQAKATDGIFEMIRVEQNDEQIKETINRISLRFKSYCLLDSKKKLQQFIKKQGTNKAVQALKHIIIWAFLTDAFKCAERGEQKVKTWIYRLERIIQSYQRSQNFGGLVEELISKQTDPTKKHKIQQIKRTQHLLQDYLFSPEHNQQLLPLVKNQKDETIVLDWSPQEFIQIAYAVVFDKEALLENSKLSKQIREHILKGPQFAGRFGERLIVKLLLQSSGVKFKKMQAKDLINYVEYSLGGGGQTFLPFNSNLKISKQTAQAIKEGKKKSKQTYDITSLNNNLNKILQKARKYPNHNVIGLPSNIDYSFNSTKIDFMFAKYASQEDTFYITTFNITVSRVELQDIKEAAQMFKSLLLKVEQYKNRSELLPTQTKQKKKNAKNICKQEAPDLNKYVINHVFLPYEVYCKDDRVIVDNLLTVSVYALSSVQFIGEPDQSTLRIFKDCMGLIKK